MGTTTPIRGLYKPARSEVGWHDLVDGNFDNLDNTADVNYVDEQNLLDEKIANKNQPGGYPGLDGSGQLDPDVLPPGAGGGQPYIVNSEAEMLALPANVGDIAIRTDINANFILGDLPPSVLVNWFELEQAPGGVTSVAGKTGDVILDEGDITGLEADLVTLATAITDEEASRIAADSTETAARIAADSAEATTRAADDATETAARIAADALLVPQTTTVNGYPLSSNITLTAADIGAGALPSGTTAVTQPPLDNSTKIATTAYSDAAVAVEKTRALAAEALLVPKTTTVNGHALSSNVTVTASDLGLATVATTGAYSDLTGKPTLPVTKAPSTHKWLASYDSTTGAFTQTQPSYSDLSGTPTLTLDQILGQAAPTTWAMADGDWTVNFSSNFSLNLWCSTAANSGADQGSPRIDFQGTWWDGSASQVDDYYIASEMGTFSAHHSVLRIQHNAGTTSDGVLFAGGLALRMAGSSSGSLTVQPSATSSTLNVSVPVNATTGYQIGGAAVAGRVLRGNGTNFISAVLGLSDLGPMAANWTTANAGFTATFNHTSGVAWTWANTTIATVSTTNASPTHVFSANYWTGAASAADTWTLQSSLAAGTNGVSTLAFTHSGSSGNRLVQFPSGTFIGNGINNGSITLASGSISLHDGNAAVQITSSNVLFQNQNLTTGSGAVLGFSSLSTGTSATRDAGISRLGAASLAIGNGTAADFTGALKLTTLTFADGTSQTTAAVAAPTPPPGGTMHALVFNGSATLGAGNNFPSQWSHLGGTFAVNNSAVNAGNPPDYMSTSASGGSSTVAEDAIATQACKNIIQQFTYYGALNVSTNGTFWFGFSALEAAALGVTNPNGSTIAFRYVQGTDTNWMAYVGTATGTFTATSTGVAPDTNYHEFKIVQDSSGNFLFYIDGVLKVTMVSGATGMPTANTGMYAIVQCTASSGTVSHRIHSVRWWSKF